MTATNMCSNFGGFRYIPPFWKGEPSKGVEIGSESSEMCVCSA